MPRLQRGSHLLIGTLITAIHWAALPLRAAEVPDSTFSATVSVDTSGILGTASDIARSTLGGVRGSKGFDGSRPVSYFGTYSYRSARPEASARFVNRKHKVELRVDAAANLSVEVSGKAKALFEFVIDQSPGCKAIELKVGLRALIVNDEGSIRVSETPPRWSASGRCHARVWVLGVPHTVGSVMGEVERVLAKRVKAANRSFLASVRDAVAALPDPSSLLSGLDAEIPLAGGLARFSPGALRASVQSGIGVTGDALQLRLRVRGRPRLAVGEAVPASSGLNQSRSDAAAPGLVVPVTLHVPGSFEGVSIEASACETLAPGSFGLSSSSRAGHVLVVTPKGSHCAPVAYLVDEARVPVVGTRVVFDQDLIAFQQAMLEWMRSEAVRPHLRSQAMFELESAAGQLRRAADVLQALNPEVEAAGFRLTLERLEAVVKWIGVTAQGLFIRTHLLGRLGASVRL